MFKLHNIEYKGIVHIKHLCIDRPVTCIMGTSGSGKTTLLRLLNRLNNADKGDITFHNKSIYDMDPIMLRRDIVMLNQNSVIYPGNIRDNLSIGRVYSEKDQLHDDDLNQILRLVKLDIALDAGCSTLSGGEKQRLCLARILLMDAQVYLMDEPSAALDKDTEMLLIKDVVAMIEIKQKQLIMVTHSQEIADAYPQAIMMMQDGVIAGYDHEC